MLHFRKEFLFDKTVNGITWAGRRSARGGVRGWARRGKKPKQYEHRNSLDRQ